MLLERYSVTSFIESENEILILLRSEHVSAHPGKWGGISGSLDNDKTIDEQAIVEIEEEIGISRKHIELIIKGEPLLFDDEKRNLRKVMFPYLFHLGDRNKIKLDWEHNQLKWIKPEDIDKYDTVPKLKEMLAQVISQ